MRVVLNECEWQLQQYKLVLVKLAMMNINAANHVSNQSSEQVSNDIIIDLSFIQQ
jgi:hypothetical protein